jgi:hypothetical protein
MICKQKILFTQKECVSIISSAENETTKWEMDDRKYESFPIISSEKNKWIFDRLRSFFEEEANMLICRDKNIIHLHKYKSEDYFDRHEDTRENRLFSVGVLLNCNFSGGDFKLYGTKNITIDKKAGNSYIFDTRIEHEISRITKGIRYSLIWFLDNTNLKIDRNKII